jgi:hypothetical protein
MAKVKQQTAERSKYSPKLTTEPSESRSSISLDYSTDGSSAFLTLDGSSLLGGQYAGESSVFTSAAAAATMANKQLSPLGSLARHNEEDEENDAASYSMSIQESTSSMQSVIPTDEELFAVGWAKALDSKSGNYYYFTLDRTKTVWENPLSHSTGSFDGQ